MNILIFGFGFIGRALAEQCYGQGMAVRAVKRTLGSDDINLPIDLDVLPLTPETFCPEWAHYGTWVITLPPSQSADYVATLHALVARAEQCGVRHLVYTSSTSVFGQTVGQYDEMSATLPESDNARQIVAVEQHLRESKVPNVDIVRLGGLYAAERHPLQSLLHKNQPISGAAQPVNMVHRERVVAGLLRVINTPQGQRIRHFVETPHLSKRDFYQREARLLGLPLPEFANDGLRDGKIVYSAFDDFGFGGAK